MDAMADPNAGRVVDDGTDLEARRIDEALGAELRAWRNKRGMNQAELAKAAQISKRTIVRLERGERPMSMDQLYRLCRALNIKPSQLINAMEAEMDIYQAP